MPRRVFAIGAAGSSLARYLRDALWNAQETEWHEGAWEDLPGRWAPRRRGDLVLAVAVPEPRDACDAFRDLRKHAGGAAAFAVVPADCSTALLREAAAAFDDFVGWPVRLEEIRHRVDRLVCAGRPAVESQALPLDVGADVPLIGRAAAFVAVLRKLVSVAPVDVPVLLTGETGTGKDLCARAIHRLSARRARPFVPVDCGALPRSLLERELFGHSRGAFTDAHREHRGLIAMADGGSLLLDEVDTLSTEAQAVLLRVLEDGTYRPLGAERFTSADVRIISASNVDLERAVGEGRFRADLFFRLAGVRLHLPPLRERRCDIPLLAEHFLMVHARSGHRPLRLEPDALAALQGYAWPGNVRQLSNAVRHAAILSDGSPIGADAFDLPLPARDQSSATLRAARAQLVGRFEKEYLDALLRRWGGNLTHASREAGQDRRALGRLIKKHALDPRAYHGSPGR